MDFNSIYETMRNVENGIIENEMIQYNRSILLPAKDLETGKIIKKSQLLDNSRKSIISKFFNAYNLRYIAKLSNFVNCDKYKVCYVFNSDCVPLYQNTNYHISNNHRNYLMDYLTPGNEKSLFFYLENLVLIYANNYINEDVICVSEEYANKDNDDLLNHIITKSDSNISFNDKLIEIEYTIQKTIKLGITIIEDHQSNEYKEKNARKIIIHK